MNDYGPWLTLVALGAFHGLNPAMGWLFAVTLGLQEQRREAVLKALGPIALGHAAAIAVVVGAVALARDWITVDVLSVIGAAALIAFGLYKWLRPLSHPRWVGMRVNGRELTAWSFLMATAHGAGLMLVPILLRASSAGADQAPPSAHAAHLGHATNAMNTASATSLIDDLLRVGIHTLAMFAVMALIAFVVYEKLGLSILRRSWFNLDRVWAGALVAAGALTLVL